MYQIADTRAALLCLVSIRKAANLFIYIPMKAEKQVPSYQKRLASPRASTPE